MYEKNPGSPLKYIFNIWKRFSCLLDVGIPKIWKKLNSHGGFLRADQGKAKMCGQMGWIGSAILQVAQKAIMRIQFLPYFWNALMKNVVKCYKHFFGYLNALKTHGGRSMEIRMSLKNLFYPILEESIAAYDG